MRMVDSRRVKNLGVWCSPVSRTMTYGAAASLRELDLTDVTLPI